VNRLQTSHFQTVAATAVQSACVLARANEVTRRLACQLQDADVGDAGGGGNPSDAVAPCPRSLTAVVTCRAKSSSVAWASPASSSRPGQTTSDASYRPRRTPFRLTCSRAHPTEVAPPALWSASSSAVTGGHSIDGGRLILRTENPSLAPRPARGGGVRGLTAWPCTPTCWRPFGATVRYTSKRGLSLREGCHYSGRDLSARDLGGSAVCASRRPTQLFGLCSACASGAGSALMSRASS
jgi:hypothetical protein